MLVWLDGRLEHAAAPAGELRPRDHGALHVRDRPLHRGGRVCRGPRVHRLEPAARSGGDADDPRATTSSSTSPTTTTPPKRPSRLPIYPNGSKTIPARSAAEGMQDGVDFITALATHPATAERLARKLWHYFVTDAFDPDPDFVRGASSVYLSEPDADGAGDPLRDAVALVPEPRQLVLPLLVARGVRRSRGERGGLCRLQRGPDAGAARPRWGRCSSSRPT